ncbi:glycosyltransferase family 2 protein [Candidatus Saccharibacteria bacterium]|nr:glycosyltransferase family 2 protein [Candidatus Saccharibacteria bacterium]
MHKYAVVIPNWNGLDWLADCLDSALTQTLPASVIVVDNGSTDGSVELIREHYPQVVLICRDKNYGFTGGVNPGLEAALKLRVEAAALLNNDAIPAPDWLEKLVAVLSGNPKVGIAAAKIRHFEDTRLDSTGDLYSTWGFPFPRGRDELDTGQFDSAEQRDVFAGSGGASLYRASMLREIGLFDQRFFAYYEDTDISFRARLAGWKVEYEPASVVRHRIGGTSARLNAAGDGEAAVVTAAGPSPFARYHSVKNFSYLYTKNMPGALYWKYLPRFWASWGMMAVSDIKRGLFAANFKANATAVWNFPGILVSRYRIQHRRQVTVDMIEAQLYHGLPPQQQLRFRRFKRAS